MVEVLPVKVLTDSDIPIFGKLNISLAALLRSGISVANSLVVTAPDLHLKTVLEHFDFGTKEVFEQSLTLVKKELEKTPVPQELNREIGKHNDFWVDGQNIKTLKKLWLHLLNLWLDQIKTRLWQDGFYQGLTENLDAQSVVLLPKKKLFGSLVKTYGYTSLSPKGDEVEITVTKGELHPADLKKLDDMVKEANKRLFIPHTYQWIEERGVKFSKVLPFTPNFDQYTSLNVASQPVSANKSEARKTTVKVFMDLTVGSLEDLNCDGVYLDSGRIFDLNKPQTSLDDLILRLVQVGQLSPFSPILYKLADKSEGMGKVRGALRLFHQKSLLEPLIQAFKFAKEREGVKNIYPVIPFVRSSAEFLQLKRELAVRKLLRKSSLQIWLELAVPENIINLEEYLAGGLDGVVLNLDELISHLSGFDLVEQDLAFYKQEVKGLVRFLDDGLRLLVKSHTPVVCTGTLISHPQVLEFLVDSGVKGVVVERYEGESINDHIYHMEKRVILKRASV